jgi:hypothetical protein
VQVHDLTFGPDGRGADGDDEQRGAEDAAKSKESSGLHSSALFRQVEVSGPRNAINVDEQAAGERPTSTRCRFCGYDEGANDARSVREKAHFQVVVACGSCGHPFAVLSRN